MEPQAGALRRASGVEQLVAILAVGRGGGQDTAVVMGHTTPEQVHDQVGEAVASERLAGLVPVARVQSQAGVVPDGADFAGARSLRESVGVGQQPAQAQVRGHDVRVLALTVGPAHLRGQLVRPIEQRLDGARAVRKP